MKIKRLFTQDGINPLTRVEYEKRNTRILNSDGSVVFEMRDAWVPKAWSRLASDILVSKYFRKAGVPQVDAEGKPLVDEKGKPILGAEHRADQVVRRMAACWRRWASEFKFFSSEEDAENFQAELEHMLIHQYAAPNSPQWFNTGLHDSYGISGPAQGHYYYDPEAGEVRRAADSYSRPQPHACFIQAINDNLVNEGGIMNLWLREARLFKYGSGTGTNFSRIRAEGEPLAGGGVSSGLMSFLKIGDRAAGAIKSGGTTRRAAKMVCLDLDHPDVEKFITWKADEEGKAKILIEAGYDSDFNGEAYQTVSGQNSNNSVRVPHAFLKAVEEDGDWNLTWRTTGEIAKTVKARDLLRLIAESAWACADPGVQFDDTINEWHTCPTGGRIVASNPCSEYMFLNDTACNLASLNLKKFVNEATGEVDIEALRHAIRIWTIVLEVSVGMASYPSREIAIRSYEYRTIGLGHANIGSLLMTLGHPYDSPEARAICGAFTAILTGESYATSAEIAREVGPFVRFMENREPMLRVIRNHRRAAFNAPSEDYEGLTETPMGIDPERCPAELLRAARSAWDRALNLGERYGYRNAQATVIAPTGTIGLLMDCDTTGVEPDFSLVKLKKLAGGGVFKIVNQSVGAALLQLGYNKEDAKAILTHVIGTGTLRAAPGVSRAKLMAKGLTEDAADRIDVALASAFDLRQVINAHAIGEEAVAALGFSAEQTAKAGFDLLTGLGFSESDIEAAEDHACGHGTVEGAPGLKPEHLAVFDCANACGRHGRRFIHYMGHVKMMAAAQPFISGAISKTINMPGDVTPEDIQEAYLKSWELGLKALALYRDGCKSSQPLNVKGGSSAGKKAGAAAADGAQSGVQSGTAGAGGAEATPASVGPSLSPIRRRLPKRRMGFTQEARVGGTKVYLRTGDYDDGTLGEIFLDLAKEGAALRSMMNCFAIAVSLGLQHGVPLKEFVDCFTFTRFEPQGRVSGHPNIKIATSVVDYIFRVLDLEYHGNTELVHVKPGELDARGRSDGRDLAAPQGLARPAAAAVESPKRAERDAARPAGTSESGPVDAGAAVTRLGNDPGVKVPEGKPLRGFDTGVATGETTSGGNGNGSGNGSSSHALGAPVIGGAPVAAAPTTNVDDHLGSMMGDAPFCEVCGHITVRNGSCYRCLNCGNSMGCS